MFPGTEKSRRIAPEPRGSNGSCRRVQACDQIDAARIATGSGTAMIITAGNRLYPLSAIETGERATLFRAVDTPVGRVPTRAALDLEGLSLSDAALATLLDVDVDVWSEEAALIPEFYAQFAERLPTALWRQHDALVDRLDAARDLRSAELAAE